MRFCRSLTLVGHLLWLVACDGGPEATQNQESHVAQSTATTTPPPYRVYVTNEGSGDLTAIAGGTHEVLATIPLGKRPRGIKAGGDRLFVALSGSPPAPPGCPRPCRSSSFGQ